MHKPLQVNYWSRLKLLFRGLLFYNTVYWRRASDGLNPPKLTAAERKRHAPPLDPEVIRPREQPRARIDEAKRREMLDELARLKVKMPAALAAKIPDLPLAAVPPAAMPLASSPPASPARPTSSSEQPPFGSFRPSAPASTTRNVTKRRRKRRAHRAPSSELPSTGLFARFLQRLMRR